MDVNHSLKHKFSWNGCVTLNQFTGIDRIFLSIPNIMPWKQYPSDSRFHLRLEMDIDTKWNAMAGPFDPASDIAQKI